MQISLTTSDSWGEDWLGDDELIENSVTHTFELPVGEYDVRALDCDQNNIIEEYGITVTSDGYTLIIE